MHITTLAKQKVLLLDGAMGTMIQQLQLPNEAFIIDEITQSVGCLEALNLSNAHYIHDIHLQYLHAGADIIETNTFGAHRFALAQYHLDSYVYDLNLAAVEIAKAAIETYKEEGSSRPLYIAGVLGPTGKSASFSSDVDDVTHRDVSFEEFVSAYEEQLEAFVDGKVDLILIETVFDSLIAKAAIVATLKVAKERQIELPIMVSATFSDKSQRMLSGQTLEAFVDTMSPYDLFSVGLNCSTGAQEMIPLITQLNEVSPFRVSAHPNAGFPDQEGHYTQSPQELAHLLEPLIHKGDISIVGGCCGTTPEHIAQLHKITQKAPPPKERQQRKQLRLSGLESMRVGSDELIVVGERCNVAGSRKFARLIKEKAYDKAVSIAKEQVLHGATLLDICMDDPLIDAPGEMVRFIRHLLAHPEVASLPFMIDSSDWNVIKTALYELQGRGVVNSISLKEGEESFIEKAQFIHTLGSAMVVMLFDEEGQADTYERKIEIALRSYNLLIKHNIPKESIIFDPNVLTIATGIQEHDVYAKAFIDATKWITEHLSHTTVSAGVSNLSFAFRGNNALRDAMHALFLEEAEKVGLRMAIINPSAQRDTSHIDPEMGSLLRTLITADSPSLEEVRHQLVERAQQQRAVESPIKKETQETQWREFEVEKRLAHALLIGEDAYLKEDLHELEHLEAVEIIEGPLMRAMGDIGQLFGDGKLYLPQVVRSARVMKQAVDILQPRLSEGATQENSKKATVVIATVKGDVHDIGKNIVALVLRCNNFEVIDLGVMVPSEKIVEAAITHKADIVGLSALITPSLHEIRQICTLFEQQGLNTPIVVGGATTSFEHTAIKLEPLFPHYVFHAQDASSGVTVALNLLSSQRESYTKEIFDEYEKVRHKHAQQEDIPPQCSFQEAITKRFVKPRPSPQPTSLGVHVLKDLDVEKIASLINWNMFVRSYRVPQQSQQAHDLIKEGKSLLYQQETLSLFSSSLEGVIGLFKTRKDDHQSITIQSDQVITLPLLRSQTPNRDGLCLSLADFIHPTEQDYIGMFILSGGKKVKEHIEKYTSEGNDEKALMLQLLADRMVEALSEYVQQLLSTQWWGFENETIIRPAIGYPIHPNHQDKALVFDLLHAYKNLEVTLTEGYSMDPSFSVCGLYVVGEGVRYFSIGKVEREQVTEYATQVGRSYNEVVDSLALDVYER
ncbi:MAG: methionine synthase [Sphaerochaetaceae bacterium]